jgi:putative membrane protein
MMASDTTGLFSPSDLERISAAVVEVERNVSGEIVPYIVGESDSYPEAPWRGAAIFGGIGLLVLGTIPLVAPVWPSFGISTVALIGLAAALAGWLLGSYVPGIRRMLIGRSTILRRVAARAAEAFVAEEVFSTKERTGILIFLSVFEHRVVVLGDAGIHRKIEGSEWDDLIAMIVDGIRTRRPADGLIRAISSAGELLLKHGFAIRPDDANELGDTLRFGDAR